MALDDSYPKPVTIYGTPAQLLRWEYVTTEDNRRELRGWVRYLDGRERLVGVQGLRMERTWE